VKQAENGVIENGVRELFSLTDRDTEWHDRRESQFLLILITLFSAEIIALLLSLPTMITGSFWNVFVRPK
jgi:hypothetical protein